MLRAHLVTIILTIYHNASCIANDPKFIKDIIKQYIQKIDIFCDKISHNYIIIIITEHMTDKLYKNTNLHNKYRFWNEATAGFEQFCEGKTGLF